MNLNPETGLFTCIGLCFALYLYFKYLNTTSSFVNRKTNLLARHRKLRAKSLKLQEALSKHILSSQVEKDIFMDTITYSDYLRYLKKNHILNLSDKNYVKLKNNNNRLFLKSVASMLDNQEVKLKQAEVNLHNILNNEERIINFVVPIFS
jgi:hypothetical protein